MYVRPDFKTKIALKRAIANGERVTIFQPGLGSTPTQGNATVEGPHYPKPHTWYGNVTLKDGVVIAVK